MDARPGQQGAGDRLIHADGGGQRAAADKGDAGHLEQPLDGSVLAVFAVQNREHNVYLDNLTGMAAVQGNQPAHRAVRREERNAVARVLLPCAACDVVRAAVGQEPAAGLVDANENDFIFFFWNVINNAFCRKSGDLMLRGTSAENHGNPAFFHTILPPDCSGTRVFRMCF